MENDKGMDFDDEMTEHEEDQGDSAPRARNRTVMLTPEITGQVRARLAQDGDRGVPSALTDPDSGFVPMSSRRNSPESENRSRFTAPPSSPPQVNMDQRPASSSFATPTSTPQGDTIVWNKIGPVVGFLVSFDTDSNGEVFVLRAGRLIVTSEPPANGNYLYLMDESVSPMHAIVRISEDGEIQVLDQLSEHGTVVERASGEDEVSLSGDKCSLEHGDVIKFGSRNLTVCLMPRKES